MTDEAELELAEAVSKYNEAKYCLEEATMELRRKAFPVLGRIAEVMTPHEIATIVRRLDL